jgi:hypothetical protein
MERHSNKFRDNSIGALTKIAQVADALAPPGNHITISIQDTKENGTSTGTSTIALSFVATEGISNQGRARSDNIAPLECDGLLFRSQPEIHLYRAFKALGVTFAPLPVFIRGGETYRRIEPDFVLYMGGSLMIVEIDGDGIHQETPLEAHKRTAMFAHEGAYIERVDATECDSPEKARECASRLLMVLTKLKAIK